MDSIVSIGGDGTVNTLIQYLAGKNIPLLVIPGGTANDLASELGHGHLKKIRQCIWSVRQNQIRHLDLINVNGRYMATNGGLGFAGDVAIKINKTRQRYPFFRDVMRWTGKNIYSFTLGMDMAFSELKIMKLSIETEQFQGIVETPLLMVNNQPKFAGHFAIAPLTSNSDGTFNITIFKHRDKMSLIKTIWDIAHNRLPLDDSRLMSFEAKSLKIENMCKDQDIPFLGDGELFRTQNTYEISVLERALPVYERAYDDSFLGAKQGYSLTDEELL
jgi:diacylglycerol kinase family enzyme